MPLDDDDRREIAELISQHRPADPPRRGRPEPSGGGATLDWDRMSPRDQQAWVRELVGDEIAALDKEAERADLKREVAELRTQLAEWEKGGRQGKKPTRESVAAGGDRRIEEAPNLVGKAFKFLFGDQTAARP